MDYYPNLIKNHNITYAVLSALDEVPDVSMSAGAAEIARDLNDRLLRIKHSFYEVARELQHMREENQMTKQAISVVDGMNPDHWKNFVDFVHKSVSSFEVDHDGSLVTKSILAVGLLALLTLVLVLCCCTKRLRNGIHDTLCPRRRRSYGPTPPHEV